MFDVGPNTLIDFVHQVFFAGYGYVTSVACGEFVSDDRPAFTECERTDDGLRIVMKNGAVTTVGHANVKFIARQQPVDGEQKSEGVHYDELSFLGARWATKAEPKRRVQDWRAQAMEAPVGADNPPSTEGAPRRRGKPPKSES